MAQSRPGVLTVSALDDGALRIVTLDRPEKANAVDDGLAHALCECIKASTRDGCRALILRGAGRNFCGGFDFTGYESLSVDTLVQRFVTIENTLQALRAAPFVSVALVQGAAFGAGADLAIACTYRLGSERARFRFPGFQFGVALGTRHLTRVVGMQKARDILLQNAVVDADEALKIGLLTERAEEADMLTRAQRLLEASHKLHADTTATILRLTADSDVTVDMSELVRSLREPGLHERIARYRAVV